MCSSDAALCQIALPGDALFLHRCEILNSAVVTVTGCTGWLTKDCQMAIEQCVYVWNLGTVAPCQNSLPLSYTGNSFKNSFVLYALTGISCVLFDSIHLRPVCFYMDEHVPFGIRLPDFDKPVCEAISGWPQGLESLWKSLKKLSVFLGPENSVGPWKLLKSP